MTNRTAEEIKFWNDKDITNYFAGKPADPRVESRLNNISGKRRKNALDLGCGGGRHTELLVRLGFNTYACDTAEEMVRFTRERASKQAESKDLSKRIIKGSITDIPFEDEKFDVIVSTGVLHQAKSLSEYEHAIKEASRVAKMGCIFCLNIFTNKDCDKTYKKVPDEPYTVITKEGLYMTLLPKEMFYELMQKYGFLLEKELSEDVKAENTGQRVVLRANFIK